MKLSKVLLESFIDQTDQLSERDKKVLKIIHKSFGLGPIGKAEYDGDVNAHISPYAKFLINAGFDIKEAIYYAELYDKNKTILFLDDLIMPSYSDDDIGAMMNGYLHTHRSIKTSVIEFYFDGTWSGVIFNGKPIRLSFNAGNKHNKLMVHFSSHSNTVDITPILNATKGRLVTDADILQAFEIVGQFIHKKVSVVASEKDLDKFLSQFVANPGVAGHTRHSRTASYNPPIFQKQNTGKAFYEYDLMRAIQKKFPSMSKNDIRDAVKRKFNIPYFDED